MNHLTLLCLTILYMPVALAHTTVEVSKDHRVLKEFPVNNKGTGYLTVREGGHLIGQPFQVELRVKCDGHTDQPMDLAVVDSFSVCDLKPESVVINKQRTALALKTKMADLNTYYDNITQYEKEGKSIPCLKKTKVKKFTLRKVCQ